MFKKLFAPKKHQGMDTMIPWYALLEPNIVLCKDGSLLALFEYRAPDASNISHEEMLLLVEKTNEAVKTLSDGFTLYFDVNRFVQASYSKNEENHFPDEVSRLMDDERRKMFESGAFFESRYHVAIHYNSHQQKLKKLEHWLFNDGDGEEKEFAQVVNFFKARVHEFALYLKYSVKMMDLSERHDGDLFQSDACDFLHYTLTGELKKLSMPLPTLDLHLKIGQKDFIAGAISKIGDKFIQCISIDGFPDSVYPGILSILDSMNVPFRWCTRFVMQNRDQAEKNLEKIEKSWAGKVFSYRDTIKMNSGSNGVRGNEYAHHMSNDANTALNKEREGDVRYGYYTSTIVVMDEDLERLKKRAAFIKEIIANSNHFNVRIENLNNEEAFFGTLFGRIDCNVRKAQLNTMNLSNLIQLSSVYSGEAYAPSPFLPENSPPLAFARTNGSNPFRLNAHVRDLGSMLIVGPSGGGKSTLLAFLMAQFLRYKDARVFAFDIKESLYAITKSVQGTHYHLGADAMSFCPMGLVDDQASMAWGVEYITQLMLMQGLTLSIRQKDMLNHAIQSIAEDEHKDLSNLLHFLPDADMAYALKHFCRSGQLGGLLDGKKNDIRFNHFNTFELDSILKMGQKNLVAVLAYLFFYIEKSLDGRPTIIVLEEVWAVMARDFLREKFTEWMVTLRKKNCSLWFTTQNLAQLYSEIDTLAAVIDTTATKIFLPNANAASMGTKDRPGSFEMYKMFGLTDHEIQHVIAKATPKKDYYIAQAQGSRLVQFDFGAEVLRYCGVSSVQDVEHFKKMENSACLSENLKGVA